MTFPRQYLAIVGAILVVTLPGGLALSYYLVTGDPSFQPLSQTVERLARASADPTQNGLAVHVRIRWSGDPDQETQVKEIGQDIAKALSAKGADTFVDIMAGESRIPTVTYHIAHSTVGPYPLTHAAEGVDAAAQAMAMLRADALD